MGGLNLVSIPLHSLHHSAVQKESHHWEWWTTVLCNTVPTRLITELSARPGSCWKPLFTAWNSITLDCLSAEHSPPATLRTHCLMADSAWPYVFVHQCLTSRGQLSIRYKGAILCNRYSHLGNKCTSMKCFKRCLKKYLIVHQSLIQYCVHFLFLFCFSLLLPMSIFFLCH